VRANKRGGAENERGGGGLETNHSEAVSPQKGSSPKCEKHWGGTGWITVFQKKESQTLWGGAACLQDPKGRGLAVGK